VPREKWLFFRSFLKDAESQMNLLLELLASLAAAHDWWLDVQADQRWRRAHPFRKWFASSVCFSPASALLPFLYPSWLFDVDDVEQRIEVLAGLHSELCRCVGLLHDGVYRLLQFRAEDPSGRAEASLQRCKAELWLRSLLLEELTRRFRVRAESRDIVPSKWLSSPCMRRPTVLDRRIAIRAADDLREATHGLMAGLRKPTPLSRYRATCCAAVAGGLGCVMLVRCTGQSAGSLTAGFMRHARGVLVQFVQEWVMEPGKQVASQLMPSVRQQIVDPESLLREKQVLTNMTRDFCSLIHLDVTPELEERLLGGDITAAVDYYERNLDEPLTHVLRGHLLASSMIQAQKIKVVMFELCQNIDGMMHDLRLNVAMSSIFPLFSLLYSAYCWLYRFSHRSRKFWVDRCRHSLDEVDRLLTEHSQPLLPQLVGESLPPLGEMTAPPSQMLSPAGFMIPASRVQSPAGPVPSTPNTRGPLLRSSSSSSQSAPPFRQQSNGQAHEPEVNGSGHAVDEFGNVMTSSFSRQISGSIPTQEPFEAIVDAFPRQISGRPSQGNLQAMAQKEEVPESQPEGDLFSGADLRARGDEVDGDAGFTWQISHPDDYIFERPVQNTGETEGEVRAAVMPPYWYSSGLLISRLCVLWATCCRGLSAREMRSFSQDLSILPSPDLSSNQKLMVVARMRRSYSCFDRRA